MIQFNKEDERYILQCVKDGISLNQAIAQAEVLREEHNFKENLKFYLTPNIIKKIMEKEIA